MSGMKPEKVKREKTVTIAIGDVAWKALQELAEKRTKENGRTFASDIAREAMQEYLQKRGYDIKLAVDRGGDRRKGRG